MRKAIPLLVFSLLFLSSPARADLFGGDIAVLSQILVQNIKQLIELQSLLGNAQDSLSLLREINHGINDSLQMIRTISPYADPGIFGELKNIEDVLRKFGTIYGTVVESPDAASQRSVDRAVAEAVTMNSAIFDYAAVIDRVGEDIKSFSHAVSPGGAAKLTAESLGVMIHVLNQQLRATGTMLKLEAEGVAAANKREKVETAGYLNSARIVSDALKNMAPTFDAPRF